MNYNDIDIEIRTQLDAEDWTIKYWFDYEDIVSIVLAVYLLCLSSIELSFRAIKSRCTLIFTSKSISIIAPYKNNMSSSNFHQNVPFVSYKSLQDDISTILNSIQLVFNRVF